jgi:N-(2-amino-2-carboxyethyl)-L-glutamate synthase
MNPNIRSRLGVLSAIGKTPLVPLKRLSGNSSLQIFAKLEAANPGGSIKDRTALYIIQDALSKGQIHSGSTVIESSSGNMAIGLAQVCSYFDMYLICVLDPKASQRNVNILQAYGAEIELVSQPDEATGEFLQARLARVQQLLKKIPGAFWPNQYSNRANSSAHYYMMAEIAAELPRVDYLFCATSTCGTLRGCAEYIRLNGLKTKVYAVDALGSMIFHKRSCQRLIPGHGAGIVPDLFQPGLADRAVLVSDLDCVLGCRFLLEKEAILAGGSSGAVVSAFNQVRHEIGEQSVCVLIFPDRGERYLETIYSEAWVQEHFKSKSKEQGYTETAGVL